MSAKLTTVKMLLEDVLRDFKKVNGESFELRYMKVVFPVRIDEKARKKFWLQWLAGYEGKEDGEEKSRCYPECTHYQLFENKKTHNPSHNVYGSLTGKNVTEGWYILNPLIKEAVKQLYLRLYDRENMPNSDNFLKRLGETLPKKESGAAYLWYEFLLTLSLESGCSVDCKGYTDFQPSGLSYKVNLQTIGTDILEASKRALRFLISKVNEYSEQTEAQQSSGKVEERTIKLTDFIRENCEDTTSIPSKANRIHEFVKNRKIDFMPKPVNRPKRNETKLYDEKELRLIWPKLRKKIISLPNLKD